MIHDANCCLCEDCMDYRAAVIRRRARMGLRPIPQIPPVAATRDAAAGVTTSSVGGETPSELATPVGLGGQGPALDTYPGSRGRVSGLTVHRGRHVAARAATDGESRLGAAP